MLLLLTSALPPVLRRLAPARLASPPAAGPFGARQERFEQLAAEVIAASDRFERLDDLAEIQRESRRLRELAHRLKD